MGKKKKRTSKLEGLFGQKHKSSKAEAKKLKRLRKRMRKARASYGKPLVNKACGCVGLPHVVNVDRALPSAAPFDCPVANGDMRELRLISAKISLEVAEEAVAKVRAKGQMTVHRRSLLKRVTNAVWQLAVAHSTCPVCGFMLDKGLLLGVAKRIASDHLLAHWGSEGNVMLSQVEHELEQAVNCHRLPVTLCIRKKILP